MISHTVMHTNGNFCGLQKQIFHILTHYYFEIMGKGVHCHFVNISTCILYAFFH